MIIIIIIIIVDCTLLKVQSTIKLRLVRPYAIVGQSKAVKEQSSIFS